MSALLGSFVVKDRAAVLLQRFCKRTTIFSWQMSRHIMAKRSQFIIEGSRRE